jgi:hypothetical protein
MTLGGLTFPERLAVAGVGMSARPGIGRTEGALLAPRGGKVSRQADANPAARREELNPLAPSARLC